MDGPAANDIAVRLLRLATPCCHQAVVVYKHADTLLVEHQKSVVQARSNIRVDVDFCSWVEIMRESAIKAKANNCSTQQVRYNGDL